MTITFGPERLRHAAAGLADLLHMAATPCFAAMALLAMAPPEGAMCAASAPGGMAAMYALMSAAHAGPWLRLAAGTRP